MSAVTLRGSISRLTRSRTLLLPNHALTFVARSDAGPTAGALPPDGGAAERPLINAGHGNTPKCSSPRSRTPTNVHQMATAMADFHRL